MKKILNLFLITALALCCLFNFSACTQKNTYVARPMESAKIEEFGLCVGKNSTQKNQIISAMNKVILEQDIESAVEYYNALALGETPKNSVEMADLTKCKGEAIKVYTCSGFEPYEFLNDEGKIIGVDIWLMSHVCKELDRKMQVIDMDFDGIVAKIYTEDNAVGAAGITINEERKKTVEFSIPYYSSVQYIISTTNQSYTNLTQLNGLCVGVQKGTTGAIMIDKDGKKQGITSKEYNTAAEAFSAMKAGKCDVLLIDALPALRLVASNEKTSFYNSFIVGNQWVWYIEGILKTLAISLGAVFIGCVIGLFVAFIKYLNKKYQSFKILSKLCDLYITVIRGTPVYLQLLIMAFIVLASAEEIWIAVITFGINSGAYVAEIIRAGLESVDDGQLEAGSSLGLNRFIVMKDIVFPQAIRHSLPPLCNEFIALIKETSIVGVIGIIDITKVAARIVAKTYEPFLPYIVSAIIYLIIVIILTRLLKLLERRLAKSDRK